MRNVTIYTEIDTKWFHFVVKKWLFDEKLSAIGDRFGPVSGPGQELRVSDTLLDQPAFDTFRVIDNPVEVVDVAGDPPACSGRKPLDLIDQCVKVCATLVQSPQRIPEVFIVSAPPSIKPIAHGTQPEPLVGRGVGCLHEARLIEVVRNRLNGIAGRPK
jgi:hypothetical protein